MSKIILCAPCNFGLESILTREIKELNYEIDSVTDGRVNFTADFEGICRANINLRTAERILIKISEFEATTFEELFQNTKKISWHDWIPKDGAFPVSKASSVKSTLFSASDIQSVVKKAVVESLKRKYNISWFEETGSSYPINVFIYKDKVTLYIDSSGMALHKRGYRQTGSEAPLKETLAAALVLLTPWKEGRLLVDPLCGSGTILIEAALKAINKPPGLHRSFISESWTNMPAALWKKSRNEGEDLIKNDGDLYIHGYDIDEKVLKIARDNAKKAGVESYIHFQKRDVRELSYKDKYGFIITNPPYGERLDDMKSVEILYKDMGKMFSSLDTWSFYILTAHEDFEKLYGKKADKKRKLYNGMIKADLYQYYGPKPPKNII